MELADKVRRRRARAIQLAASPVNVPELSRSNPDDDEFVDVFPAACMRQSSAQSAIRSLETRGTKRPSPLAGGRETKHAHSLERFAREPLRQASVLRFRNRLHHFGFGGKSGERGLNHEPAQLLGGDFARLPAPNIDGQLAGQGDERSFALA